jgi:hypothetical protein
MASGEKKAVAIQPTRRGGREAHGFAEKDGTDFRAAEGKAEVARGTGVNRIHSESTGLIGGGRENSGIHKRISESGG